MQEKNSSAFGLNTGPDERERGLDIVGVEKTFSEYLGSYGYSVTNPIVDGEIHRFCLDDKDKKDSGWYCVFPNKLSDGREFFVLTGGDWRTNSKIKPFNTLNGQTDKTTAILVREQIKISSTNHKKTLQKNYEEASEEAQKLWDTLSVCGHSSYFDRKGILDVSRLGIRFDHESIAYVPLRDAAGKLWNLQWIFPSGRKLFMQGAKASGTFHILGDLASSSTVYIAEGFATAASVHLATDTGSCTIFARNTGGLRTLKDHFPENAFDGKEVVICGDDDLTPGNPGRKAAEFAARSIRGARAVFPRFKEAFGKDWNDLHFYEGLEEVKRQLQKPIELVELVDKDVKNLESYPDVTYTAKGAPRLLGTMKNLEELLRRLNITVRYNVISKREEIIIPGIGISYDNKDNVVQGYLKDWCARIGMPVTDLALYILSIADKNQYNPALRWIESEPWDGESRLDDFFDTIKSPNDKLKRALMKRWLISAIAGLYEPEGVSASGVLVLQGAQYVGKTRWFKRLVPQDMGVTADGVSLDTNNKDSVYNCISKWLVELGELDSTFKRSDIAQLKAFVGKEKDYIRLPYMKAYASFVRRTVFFASVNEEQFLVDTTGNRRFWTVACDSIEPDHDVNMQQLWAEALDLYKQGEQWWLTPDEFKLLTESNKQFEMQCPIEELILTKLDWADVRRSERTLGEVFEILDIKNPPQRDYKALSRALQKVSGKKMRPSNGRRLYSMAPLLIRRARDNPLSLRDG